MNNKIFVYFPFANFAGCVASTIIIHRLSGGYEEGAD